MKTLDLNYFECTDKLRTSEMWLQNLEVNHAFAGLAENLANPGNKLIIAIYGSSWSGYMAYQLLQKYNIGSVDVIFEKNKPLDQLSHIRHINLEIHPCPFEVDCVLISASPRHYDQLTSLVARQVKYKSLIGMYQQFPSIDSGTSDMLLAVFVRFNDMQARKSLPLNSRQIAVILIDIWDTGRPTCAYCKNIPRLLEIARRHDLVVIHAPGYECDEQGRCISKNLASPSIKNASWLPFASHFFQQWFGHHDIYSTSMKEPVRPVVKGIHSCALPVKREKEYVEASQDGVKDILVKHDIHVLLYAGGDLLECLMLNPAGYMNMARLGYQPILIRDASSAGAKMLDGKMINMFQPGVIVFERSCGFSTTIKNLDHSLENRHEIL
jgi:hypothetical protein